MYWGETGGTNPGYSGPDPGASFPLYVDHYGDPFTVESVWLVYNCSTYVTSSAGGDSWSSSPAIGQGIDNLTLNSPPAKVAEPSAAWLFAAAGLPLWWRYRRCGQSLAAINRSTYRAT